MHINNLPVELFSEILEYIPLKDASAIMQVNRQWYQEYRGVIHRQCEAKLEELFYSHWSDWNIPLRLVVYFNWHDFFIDKEREVIDNLLTHYEKSPDFEGLFPEWLWERHKNNRQASAENCRHINLLYTLMRKASCIYFQIH